MEKKLNLANRDDIPHLNKTFTQRGRLQITQLLENSSVEKIYQALKTQSQWNIVWNDKGKHIDMDYAGVMQLPKEKLAAIQHAIYTQASTDFQYFYANIPIYDIVQKQLLPGHFFHQIYHFINSQEVLSLVRKVTGNSQISFADAQATRYSAGHFLTEHDDDVAGKGRVAAYVLNLTPNWKADWGGALVFPNSEPGFSDALFPSYNALNLFSVPQRHAVTMISPFATESRYAITGWFRTGHTTE